MQPEGGNAARVITLADHAPTPDAPAQRVASGRADIHLLGEGARPDAPADAWLVLDGDAAGCARYDFFAPAPPGASVPAGARVLSYRAHVDAAAPDAPARARADPARVQSNAFEPLAETPRIAAALISIAAGRRMDAGPESERAFVVLEGSGLVFLQNEDTLPFVPGDLVIVPEGEPARVWARGPADVRLVALQPQTPPAEQRTLLGEIRKRRADEDGA